MLSKEWELFENEVSEIRVNQIRVNQGLGVCLYIQIPNIYLELGFEFAPQRLVGSWGHWGGSEIKEGSDLMTSILTMKLWGWRQRFTVKHKDLLLALDTSLWFTNSELHPPRVVKVFWSEKDKEQGTPSYRCCTDPFWERMFWKDPSLLFWVTLLCNNMTWITQPKYGPP